MKGYKFRLQKLLDIRISQEKECKRKFQEAQNIKLQVEKNLNFIKDNYNRYRNLNNEKSIIEKKIKNQYLVALSSSMQSTYLDLKNKENILDKIRRDLKEKQISRKTVEILKEKGLNAFIKNAKLVEQKSNDEIALYTFLRNRERR